MMLLSMKPYPALLWRLCVLFAVESMAASTPETSGINVTVEPYNLQLTTAHVPRDEKETQYVTWGAEDDVASVAAESTVLPTVEKNEEATVNNKTNSLDGSTVGLAVTAAAAATTATSSSSIQLLHTSRAATTAAGEAQSSHYTTITETAKQTEDWFHQQSATTSSNMTAPATTSAAFSATVAVSSPQPTPVTQPGITPELSSTTSSHTKVPVFTQKLSSPPAPATTTVTTIPTSEAAPVFNPTSSPHTITETSTSTEPSSASRSVSATSSLITTPHSPDTTASSSTPTSVPTDSPSSTTDVSTSPAGILIPGDPKKLPNPPTKSAPATTATPREVSKSPSGTEVPTCSTRGIVKQCLVVIACLAGLATIFIVSTIVLCTKLSTRKYKVKKPQQATEMMCISALLPERNYTYTRQRNPVSNGVLVIPGGGDSDEDGGDNLTLSSFLPENDRLV